MVVDLHRGYVVLRYTVVRIRWMILVVPCEEPIICYGILLGLGEVRTRCVAMIRCVCWCRSDRATGKVIVCLAVGRVVVLQECLLRLVESTRD